MTADLISESRARFQQGLLRQAVQTASRWACKYRMMKGMPWTFRNHPWLKGMHDSLAEENIGQKSAQMGFTEVLLNLAFFKVDVMREDVLYVLPNKTPDATDFSVGRFDAALDASPHLSNLFSDIKNVGLKRTGSCSVYIRGSRGRSGLKSIPAPNLFFDERDEMDKEQVVLALERASGQMKKNIWQISTPRVDDSGINAEFRLSSQENFVFQCPHCAKHVCLTWPDCFVLCGETTLDPKMYDSYVCCPKCKHKLEHEAKPEFLKDGVWGPTVKSPRRGFYINQLYSCALRPHEIARHAILANTDLHYEQELWNSKMGLPHLTKGAQVTEAMINGRISDFRITDNHDTKMLTTMGVDVGSWNHVIIQQWLLPSVLGADLNTQAIPRTIQMCKVRDFGDLDRLMRRYNINACVIDMFPERRMAKQFADRFPGYVKLCYYARSISGRSLIVPKDEDETIIDWRINVDRTSWLDTALGRFHTGRVLLPQDTEQEFKEHIQNIVRVPKLDKDDNPIVEYETKENKQDHYAHAFTYAEIALPLAVARSTGQDIAAFL